MFPLVAALPMYDWPEMRAQTDHAWAAMRDRLRAAGIAAPEHLARRNADLPAVPGGIRDAKGRLTAPDPATLPPDDLHLPTLWRHPALVLAQTCWGPMEQGLAENVTVMGQGDYSAFEGGEGELYSSAILMRANVEGEAFQDRDVAPPLPAQPGILRSSLLSLSKDRAEGAGRRMRDSASGRDSTSALNVADLLDQFNGKRLAYNGTDSMSGLISLQRDLEAVGGSLTIFSDRLETGSHRASIVAVAEGRADICAVDCRTWCLARRFEPHASALAVVGWTSKRRGLPFITARGTNASSQETLRVALSGVN